MAWLKTLAAMHKFEETGELEDTYYCPVCGRQLFPVADSVAPGGWKMNVTVNLEESGQMVCVKHQGRLPRLIRRLWG